MEIKSNDSKEKFHVYASGNLCFQISNLELNWDKDSKAKGKHKQFQKVCLDPYGDTWKTSMSIHYPWSDVLLNFLWVFFYNIMYIFTFIWFFFHASSFFSRITFLSIRELIGIFKSNYRLVDDNFTSPLILSRSPVFHDTFWTDKVIHLIR